MRRRSFPGGLMQEWRWREAASPGHKESEGAQIMKLTMEIDCTPEEARRFLGLPDVTAVNEMMVSEIQKHIHANMALLSPDELVKSWLAFGAGAQEQFRQLMEAGMGAAAPRK
jgi:hypothetical protein